MCDLQPSQDNKEIIIWIFFQIRLILNVKDLFINQETINICGKLIKWKRYFKHLNKGQHTYTII